MNSEFEWDPTKAETNLKKHGVSFDEASSVFDDPLFITLYDVDHSVEEDRYITIGRSNRNRLLLVAHNEDEEIVRIISARKATNRERQFYEETE